MIEAAERDGRLRPGGTIVEATSGNTGVGLAMVAAQRGYRCVFVMPDKMSREKIALLRAFGAEVVVCPTEVEPEDPRSYYSVSERMAKETPGAYNPNQYANSGNPQAHYDSTGPEIWEQLGDELDVLVVGVGTGGTVTGTGPLSQGAQAGHRDRGRRPRSARSTRRPSRTPISSRAWARTSGRRRSTATSSIAGSQVSDREAFSTTRRLARLEGILIGASGGMALHAALRVAHELPPDKTVLVILPDGGRPYLSKVFNDDWMLVHGMFDDTARPPTAGELVGVAQRRGARARERGIAAARRRRHRPAAALRRLAAARDRRGRRGRSAACTSARCSTARCATAAGRSEAPTAELMSDPLPVVQSVRRLDDVYHDLQSSPAVLVADGNTPIGVLTRADVLEWLAHA